MINIGTCHDHGLNPKIIDTMHRGIRPLRFIHEKMTKRVLHTWPKGCKMDENDSQKHNSSLVCLILSFLLKSLSKGSFFRWRCDRKLRKWTLRLSFWTLFVVFLIVEPQGSYSPVHGDRVQFSQITPDMFQSHQRTSPERWQRWKPLKDVLRTVQIHIINCNMKADL